MKNKSYVFILFYFKLFLINSLNITAQQKSNSLNADIRKSFLTPPDSVKPSVYWYWMMGNISADGIEKDLKAMSQIGIGRAFIANIGSAGFFSNTKLIEGPVKMFSPEWWACTKKAINNAGKYGIDIGLFNGPGWSQSGGPWINPSQSMRYLAGVEWKVKGPVKLSKKLPDVKENFQDVAVLAFPNTKNKGQELLQSGVTVATVPAMQNPAYLIDGDVSTESIVSVKNPHDSLLTIEMETKTPLTVQSLVLYPIHQSLAANCELLAFKNNKWQRIKAFDFNRTNTIMNIGFDTFAPVVVAFHPITSSKFILRLKNIVGVAGLAEIRLANEALLERYPEKQLAKMFPTPLPLWHDYQWETQPEPANSNSIINGKDIIELTNFVNAEGVLEWNVPPGEWAIIRYGMLPTGVMNSPSPPEGQGLEVDKINDAAIEHHFKSFVGKVQDSLNVEGRRALKWVVADSYETGSQNWTDGMQEKFKLQFGYNPLKYLPTLSGRIVVSADQSDRFLWDLRRFVADNVAYQYVGGLRKVSNRYGLKLWLENYGHWGFPSEFLTYGGQADEVSGEFWNEGVLGGIECKAASSAAHIYGKTIVSAESFTSAGLAYARHPALLKKRGDWSFTEGINNTLLHVYIHQPDEKLPGANAWFGTEFNRHNTWFYQGKAFIDYMRRCNFLLQQGKPVNDIAYYIGEDAPKMTGIREPELPLGYSYDYINSEVIIDRLNVVNGRLVLPDGMSYRMLVLPPSKSMRPEVLKKIVQLVKNGATVLGPKPSKSPSLSNFPQADIEIKRMADLLWGKVTENHRLIKKIAKGHILSGIKIEEAFKLLNLPPDVLINHAGVLYTHRTTADSSEIYFLTNQTEKAIEFFPAFRTINKQPELWDAVSGKSRKLPGFYKIDSNSTVVPLKLEPLESTFIVFSQKVLTPISNSKINFPNPKKLVDINSPWLGRFDSTRGGPTQPVKFEKLYDWSLSNDDKIKNYSGTAVYTNNFYIDTLYKGSNLLLKIGQVGVMANVSINGQLVGNIWTAPWAIDVTGYLIVGLNKIEIEVVNTWVNRLIGDSKIPENNRQTWTTVNTYSPDSVHEKSGLLGPVSLFSFKYE
jgi:hypothetical protein